jgi:5-methylcytosine-specific restriction endonuclease McrA
MDKPKKIKRAYIPVKQTRGNDKFYHSKEWRQLRAIRKNYQLKEDQVTAYQVYQEGEVELREYNEWQESNSPLCVHCLEEKHIKPANTLDHITPIKDGGMSLDIRNLQWLCEGHHAIKSAKEKR